MTAESDSENVIRLLHLEDNSNDAEIIADTLREGGLRCEITRVDNRKGFLTEIEDKLDEWQVILADYSLPSFDGLSALKIAQEKCPEVPFIFVSGAVGEEKAVEMLKSGATDYVLKDRLARLPVAVGRALRERAESQERRQAEALLNLRTKALESAANGVVITDREGTIIWANPACTTLTGYTSAELLGRNPRILKSGLQDEDFYGNLWTAILEGKVWRGEITNRRKDGTLYIEEQTITPVRNTQGEITSFIAIKQDVTERQRAQEALSASETRYRRLFEAAQDGILLVDPETAIITGANPFIVKLLGYGPEEILGKKLWEIRPFRDVAASETAFRSLEASGYVRYEDLPLETKSGDRIDVEFVSNVYRVGAKEVIQCNIRDMTERKRQQDRIRASLQEKEMLLKEIHHRVKNNLQVISSLLQLQSRASRDREFLEILREAQTRVRTMALIHEKLYQSKDFAHIDFGEYVRSLVTDLLHSYRTDPESVSFSVQSDHVVLGVDTAIPCALIVNELVSNCLKHAFPTLPSRGLGGGSREAGTETPRSDQPSADVGLPKRRGSISVALNSGEGNRVRMVVSDNGSGFPKSLDFRHTQSLGLQLVNTLTEQLGGTIEMRADAGTAFQIEFPA